MKHKKVALCILLLGLGLEVQAQQAITVAGGDASGSGGSVSYSVGQIVFTTFLGSTGSTTQGVQQTYEISNVLDINNLTITLEIDVFPNPTTNSLTLKFENAVPSILDFQLIDMSEKLIESRKINNQIETISMEHLPNSTYFLNVIFNGLTVKIFKIIKN